MVPAQSGADGDVEREQEKWEDGAGEGDDDVQHGEEGEQGEGVPDVRDGVQHADDTGGVSPGVCCSVQSQTSLSPVCQVRMKFIEKSTLLHIL